MKTIHKVKILLGICIHLLVLIPVKGQSIQPEKDTVVSKKNRQWIHALMPLQQEQQLDSIRGRILQNYHKNEFDNRSPVFIMDGYLPQFLPPIDSLEIYTLLSFLTPKYVEKVSILTIEAITQNTTFCNPANGIVLISFKDKKPIKKLKALSKGKNKNWS